MRKHVKTRTTERQTTGSTAKVVIRRGERLPNTVEVEEFPETVYREASSLRITDTSREPDLSGRAVRRGAGWAGAGKSGAFYYVPVMFLTCHRVPLPSIAE